MGDPDGAPGFRIAEPRGSSHLGNKTASKRSKDKIYFGYYLFLKAQQRIKNFYIFELVNK